MQSPEGLEDTPLKKKRRFQVRQQFQHVEYDN